MTTHDEYKIIHVPKDAADADELMGSKRKFWYRDEQLNYLLWKLGRPNTGEDWAEKVACELARLMGLAHAEYDLAEYDGQLGIVSKNLLRQTDEIKELLVHGNEWLLDFVPDYPKQQVYRVSAHTFEAVSDIINKYVTQLPIDWTPPTSIRAAIDLFVGYLVFDAWIGNTDRHHENWASKLTWQTGKGFSTPLAPTYDHASSLGSHLTDNDRNRRLLTSDERQSVSAYAAKARSALYLRKDDSKPMTAIDVVRECQRDFHDSVSVWIEKIAGIDDEEVMGIMCRVPESRMSSIAKKFAYKLLQVNRERLVSMQRLTS